MSRRPIERKVLVRPVQESKPWPAGDRTLKLLETRERELRECQRVAGVGSWYHELDTGVSTWSDETFRLHGLEPGCPVPSLDEIPEFYSPKTAGRILAALQKAIKAGTPYEIELQLQRPGCGRTILLARGEAIRDDASRVVALRGTVLDVTERTELQERLDSLREQLAHAARVNTLGAFASSLAHELCQPISAILLNAEDVLAQLTASAEGMNPVREAVEDILRDAGRAAAVIEWLRGFLRKTTMVVQDLDISAAIEEVKPIADSVARTQNSIIKFSISPAPLPGRADRIQFQQVLLNLILNALEASRDGTGQATVLVSACETAHGVEVRVADSGPGIPHALRERIFEPFFTTKPAGLGIGLSASRSLIESFSGKLLLEEGTLRGATFLIVLPKATSSVLDPEE